MNIFDKHFEALPEYSKYMYLEGYTPEEILEAKRRQIEAEAIEKEEEEQLSNMKIKVEVKKNEK